MPIIAARIKPGGFYLFFFTRANTMTKPLQPAFIKAKKPKSKKPKPLVNAWGEVIEPYTEAEVTAAIVALRARSAQHAAYDKYRGQGQVPLHVQVRGYDRA